MKITSSAMFVAWSPMRSRWREIRMRSSACSDRARILRLYVVRTARQAWRAARRVRNEPAAVTWPGACLVASASCRRFSPEDPTTLNYSINHTRSRSNSCSASMAPWLISTSPLPAPPFCRTYDFHVLSRAFRPSWNQLRKSSSAASRPRYNGTAPGIVYGFAGAGKAAALAISHFPPCLTKVLM